MNAIRKMHAALIAGTPTDTRIGSTMEPTIMIEPRPLSVVNRIATATTMMRVTTNGRSPPSSALFLMMFSVTPVLFINWPSHAPKITAMMALPIRTVPFSTTVCSQPMALPSASVPTAGTPAMMQMMTAISGSANSVGIFLVIISAAMTKKTTMMRIPCSIILLLTFRGQGPLVLCSAAGRRPTYRVQTASAAARKAAVARFTSSGRAPPITTAPIIMALHPAAAR